MTDHGFRKFRRRRKRDEGSAAVASRPVTIEPSFSANGASHHEPLEGDAAGHGVWEAQAEWQENPTRSSVIAGLPARLPDPWPILRRVDLCGLTPRRSPLPLVDFFRRSPTARAFDLLRTRLLQTLRDHGWRRVAVCAPTMGCGASFTAANLALSLARVPGSRTVLMDMNLRSPGVARALGLETAALYNGDMRGFLRGEVRLEDHLVSASDSLALGLNSEACFNAAEVLHEARCAETVDRMMDRTKADVALFDLPPVLENDDVAAFLPQVDGVLLVSDGTKTTAQHLKACEKMLAGHTQLLGVALNRARASDSFSNAR